MIAGCQRAVEPSSPGPPPFAGTTPPQRRCASPTCPVPGGAILSRYNRRDDGLCESCAGKLREFDHESLTHIVGGLLLIELGLAGPEAAEPIVLRERLRDLGIRADHRAINEAVRKCRRRRIALVVEGADWHEGASGWQRGYRVVRALIWRRPRRRPRKRRRTQLHLEL